MPSLKAIPQRRKNLPNSEHLKQQKLEQIEPQPQLEVESNHLKVGLVFNSVAAETEWKAPRDAVPTMADLKI